MIKLDQLSQISENSDEIKRREEIFREEKNKQKYDKIYHDAIDDLEAKLTQAASDGKRHLSVAIFSAFGTGCFENFTQELFKRRGRYVNFVNAWKTCIFEKDVIETMTGNFKRVYEYLSQNGLNPQIKYWTDGGGMDEGFEIYVQW